jgi:hypothetical protein
MTAASYRSQLGSGVALRRLMWRSNNGVSCWRRIESPRLAIAASAKINILANNDIETLGG